MRIQQWKEVKKMEDDIDTSNFDLYVVDKSTGESNLVGKNMKTSEELETVYMPINDKWNMKLFTEQCK